MFCNILVERRICQIEFNVLIGFSIILVDHLSVYYRDLFGTISRPVVVGGAPWSVVHWPE